MQRKQVLVFVIAFQMVILLAMFAKAFYPLWLGKEILLKVEARDPRDIFAGNYAVLNYNLNLIDLDSIQTDIDSLTASKFNFGDKVYVEVAKKGKYYEPIAVWKEKPQGEKLYLRMLVQDKPYSSTLSLKGGIESYFTSKENAETLEKMVSWENRDSVDVEVVAKVAPDGAIRIATVSIVPK